MLPDTLRRLQADPIVEIQRFTLLGGKNNFVLVPSSGSQRVYLMKTHETIGGWLKALWKIRPHDPTVAEALGAINFGRDDVFAEGKLKILYLVRNPFNTLLSAVRYIKILLQRPGVMTEWTKDGRAERWFITLLGMKALPMPDEFGYFSILAQSSAKLESLLWRFLESGASIPAFEEEEKPGYFAHVNYFSSAIERNFDGVIDSYEMLMAQHANPISAIAGLLNLDAALLKRALRKELDVRSVIDKQASSFYGDFNVQTPKEIKNLPSWPEMKRYVSVACPPLADLC